MQYSQDAGGELQKYQDDQGEWVSVCVCERERERERERRCWFDERWGTTKWVMSDDELSCRILILL
jgi:putative hemolysin